MNEQEKIARAHLAACQVRAVLTLSLPRLAYFPELVLTLSWDLILYRDDWRDLNI